MKQKLAAAFMLAAICFITVFVHAESEIDVNLNTDTFEIKVTGELGQDRGNRRILLYCVPEGTSIELDESAAAPKETNTFKIFKQGISDENGFFSFDNLRINSTEKTNDYVFYLTIENDEIARISAPIRIASAQDISDFISGVSNQPHTAILSRLNGISEDNQIGLDLHLYDMLSEEGKTEVAKTMEYKAYSKISEVENDINAGCVDTALFHMVASADIDKFLYPDAYEDMSTYAAVVNERNGFAQYLAANVQEAQTLQQLTMVQRKSLYERIIQMEPESNADFYANLSFAVLLYEIDTVSGYGDITTILEKYKDSLLKDMDYAQYKSSGRMETINKAIMGKTFSSLTELCKYVNDESKNIGSTSKPGGGSGHSGSSSNSGSTAGGSYAWPDPEATQTLPIDASTTATVFSDIEAYTWAKTAILGLHNLKIISGTGDGLFEPERNITREEFLKMLVLVKGYQITTGSCQYQDVDPDAWYAPYIYTSAEQKIVNGISDYLFGIGEAITRQDAAVFIWRASGAPGAKYESNFTDKDSIDEYAKTAIGWMQSQSFISGYDDKSFRPQNSISRAEAAKILYLLAQKKQ